MQVMDNKIIDHENFLRAKTTKTIKDFENGKMSLGEFVMEIFTLGYKRKQQDIKSLQEFLKNHFKDKPDKYL